MGDDDVIDEPLQQWSALGTQELVQGGLPPPATGLQALGPRGAIHLWLRLRRKRAPRLGPALWGVRHLLSCALARVTPDALRQVDLQPPGWLPCELGEGRPEDLAPGRQGLGPPGVARSPREGLRHAGWRAQEPAPIRPDPLVQGSGRGNPRGAALSPGRPQRLGPPVAAIVGIAGGGGGAPDMPVDPGHH